MVSRTYSAPTTALLRLRSMSIGTTPACVHTVHHTDDAIAQPNRQPCATWTAESINSGTRNSYEYKCWSGLDSWLVGYSLPARTLFARDVHPKTQGCKPATALNNWQKHCKHCCALLATASKHIREYHRRFRLVSHFPLGLFATCRLLFSVKGRRRHKFYLKIRVTCLVFLGDKTRSKNCTTKDARCTTQQRLSQVAHQRKTSTGCSLSQVYILVYLSGSCFSRNSCIREEEKPATVGHSRMRPN